MASRGNKSNDGKKAEHLRRSYRFLLDRETRGVTFTVDELAEATDWKPATIRTYFQKKWSQIVFTGTNGYRVDGLSRYTEDEYVRLMSQKQEVSADPKKPQLKPEVEVLVRKARDSALLALQVYNNPTTVFRTEGFVIMMTVAWTALFHAVFEQRGESYFYKAKDGSFLEVDGDKKAWDLDQCMTGFWAGDLVPERKNLELISRLRNKIVHRFAPPLDPQVAGECQALLLNFDALLVREFGNYYAIRESLAVPLQTATVRTETQALALRQLQAKHFDELKEFIDAFRQQLPDEVLQSPKFCVRVYLVPKSGNHPTSSDLSLQFVKYDPSRADEFRDLEKRIALLTEKQVPFVNANLMKPSRVAQCVFERLNRPFGLHHHTQAWHRYQVRGGAESPGACNRKFCVPDGLNPGCFGYTEAWVEFLVEKLSNEAEYRALVATKLP